MNEALTAADVRRTLAGELSLPARLRYIALLLISLAMVGVIGALLLTETGLPTRTRVTFGLMLIVAMAWATFASWVLARRQVLFARHRIAAGRMAVTFSMALIVGTLAIGMADGTSAPWYGALGVGFLMLLLSAVQLHRAQRRHAQLRRRRLELEHELGQGDANR